jgi:hypothetical protein
METTNEDNDILEDSEQEKQEEGGEDMEIERVKKELEKTKSELDEAKSEVAVSQILQENLCSVTRQKVKPGMCY